MKPTSSPVRVLALAPYPEQAPSTRVRVTQFQQGLAQLGIDVTLHPFLGTEAYPVVRAGGAESLWYGARATAALAGVLTRIGSHDVVWIQRGVAPGLDVAVLHWIMSAGVPVVYDFDDAVYLPQEGGRRWSEALRRPAPTTRAFCRGARMVLAGNDHLASFAREAVGEEASGRVSVLPSVVDIHRLTPASAEGRGTPTLGWMGSDSTVRYLEGLAPALAALARRVTFRLLVVAGGRRPEIPGVDVEVVPWSLAEEAAQLRRMDVGLYPVDDTPWSQGKCGFKALQYLSCGVPCVASPVGVLRDIVTPGVTGFLAKSGEEWVEACASLLADGDARRRMGREGRARVTSRYSVDAVLPRLAEAFFSLAGRV